MPARRQSAWRGPLAGLAGVRSARPPSPAREQWRVRSVIVRLAYAARDGCLCRPRGSTALVPGLVCATRAAERGGVCERALRLPPRPLGFYPERVTLILGVPAPSRYAACGACALARACTRHAARSVAPRLRLGSDTRQKKCVHACMCVCTQSCEAHTYSEGAHLHQKEELLHPPPATDRSRRCDNPALRSSEPARQHSTHRVAVPS